jgi:hypothetical protein
MLLNRIPVLDKGYVALVDSCNTTAKLREIDKEYFNSKFPPVLLDLAYMTIVIKCPLFVQLNLSKFNFKVVTTYGKQEDQIEAYLPNPGEIGAKERDICETVSDDLSRTTSALLINPLAYRADGVDRFMSQILTPINIYTTLIVQGSYDEWCKFCDQNKAPAPIAAYIDAVKQIKNAEWK